MTPAIRTVSSEILNMFSIVKIISTFNLKEGNSLGICIIYIYIYIYTHTH